MISYGVGFGNARMKIAPTLLLEAMSVVPPSPSFRTEHTEYGAANALALTNISCVRKSLPAETVPPSFQTWRIFCVSRVFVFIDFDFSLLFLSLNKVALIVAVFLCTGTVAS